MLNLKKINRIFTIFSVACGSLFADGSMSGIAENGYVISTWAATTIVGATVQANLRNPAGIWKETASNVSTGNYTFDPIIAVASNNAGTDVVSVIVWTEIEASTAVLKGSLLTGSAENWTEPLSISVSGEEHIIQADSVFIKDAGEGNLEVVVIWRSYSTSSWTEQVRSSSAMISSAPTWTAPITISTTL